ncbi:hypothetical protein I7I51_05401 [Histoplasma capsulatum]|uniref:Uncharacterized protein n=1 Tax=Ajellomyces capsulatus TaxID=5037 RepID=A0A8A1M5K9_AJECA|nr:hypothetical protein I7I51_05401 [Histoplasma capsulatum]
MTDGDTNHLYPNFSARSDERDERLSDLSKSLVGPGHLFQSQSQFNQPWHGQADAAYTADGNSSGIYHDNGSQFHSVFTYNAGQQNTPAHDENHKSSGDEPSDLELLQAKRAKALASLSQRRASSHGANSGNADAARRSSGTLASLTQGSESAIDQPLHAKGSAAARNAKSSDKDTPAAAESPSGRMGAVEQQKPHPNQIASAEDIDGLLAEGRVSAVSVSKSSATGQQSGEDARATRRTSIPLDENSAPAADYVSQRRQTAHKINPILGPEGRKASCSSAANETAGSSVADNVDCASHPEVRRTSGQSDHKPVPERRVYEPPKRTWADSSVSFSVSRKNGSSLKAGSPLSKRPTPGAMQSNWDVDNEFSKLQPNEIEEIREWLEHTGYYDETYRRGRLNRFRRLAALEREKEELMREEVQEREALTKNSDRASYLFSHKLSFDSSGYDPQANSSMPPPPLIPKTNTTSSTMKFSDTTRNLSLGVSDDHTPSHVSKRQYSHLENGDQHERAEKIVRTHSNSNSKDVLHNEEVQNFINKERINMIKDHKFSALDKVMRICWIHTEAGSTLAFGEAVVVVVVVAAVVALHAGGFVAAGAVAGNSVQVLVMIFLPLVD